FAAMPVDDAVGVGHVELTRYSYRDAPPFIVAFVFEGHRGVAVRLRARTGQSAYDTPGGTSAGAGALIFRATRTPQLAAAPRARWRCRRGRRSCRRRTR